MALLAPAALLATLLGASCSSIDCPVENIVSTVYGFRKAGGVSDTLRDTLTITTTRRDGSDSVLLNKLVNAVSFELPISYNAPEDTLFVCITDTFGTTTLDTAYITKDNYPHFESVDCNVAFFHYITSVRTTSNGIDSIAINKRNVDYDRTTEHMFLYLKARH